MLSNQQGAPAAVFERAALFYADAHEFDPVDTIEQHAELVVEAQDAKYFAPRCLRPLCDPDGNPILRPDRPEPVRAVLAGVFDRRHLREAAKHIADLNARSAEDPRDTLGFSNARGRWQAYYHCQRVNADVTNRFLPGSRGTVTAEGIDAYTVVPGDLDPDPALLEAEPGRSVEIANDLTEVLVDKVGIDPRAMQIQQSGRGCYLQANIEPQTDLTKARPVIRDAIKTLAQLVSAAGAAVQIDAAVHDPARILRIAGTTNWKPGADPTTPSWILRPFVPSVRIPWATIERLALLSRPKLRLVDGGRPKRARQTTSRPLLDVFRHRAMLYGIRGNGIADVKCPWADQHSDGRDNAILFPPKEAGSAGWFHCSHAHCSGRGLADVYRALGDD